MEPRADLRAEPDPTPGAAPPVRVPSTPAAPLTQRGLSARARSRIGFFALVFGLLAAALGARGASRDAEGGADRSLAAWLTRHRLTLDEPPTWLSPPQGALALRPVLFVAHRPGELDDIYYADVRASESGALLDVFWLTDVTRSSSADEGGLVRIGSLVAYSVRVGEQSDAVAVLDTRGEPPRLTRRWALHTRVQNAITNLQETGRLRGFGRRHYSLTPPADDLALIADGERWVATADGERIVLDPKQLDPLEGKTRVRAQELQKGQPGTITWVVDTVRNVSWIGPEPIAWLEHGVFGVTDRVTRTYHRIFPDAAAGAEMRDALRQQPPAPAAAPEPEPAPPQHEEALLDASEPETGLPPAPLEPVLGEKVRGEGRWIALADDAFVTTYPNAPAAFYQTFLRVDPERPYESVYITLWDPRQVQLHLAMGTQEPESATGETGTGLIPRDPELLSRLVGAFNGGFQAMHGEFGMMAEGRVYLPPKPYAATVAVFEDGRVGMGSWPAPAPRVAWDEETANAQIPHDMVGMRQNLTSVVEDGAYNPWQRWWWGAAPEWAEEQTYIARSGLCVTSSGHMAYLWGETMGPAELGKAMQSLHCVRGMHLDMNTKHTGFEFYRAFAPQVAPPPLGRALGDMEFEGKVEQSLGYTFRARLAVKTMSPQRFPRYLQRDGRDYFFLSLKPVLPGPAVEVDGAQVSFSTSALPQAGWPAAFARAHLGGEDPKAGHAGTWLVRIDPARAVPAPLAPPELDRRLATLIGVDSGSEGELALYATRVHGVLRYRMASLSPRDKDAHVVLRGAPLADGAAAERALGVDADGFLIYAEASGDDAAALAARLHQAGVKVAMALPKAARLAFVQRDALISVDGRHELHAADAGLPLMAETRPAASAIFGDVKPLPYWRWAGPQGQRVRYFPSGAPRFRAPEDALNPQASTTPAPASPR
jgi:hypothetical protein